MELVIGRKVQLQTKYGFSLEANEGGFANLVRANGCWEGPESDWLCTVIRPGDLAIDVGCHVGYFSRLMAECGATVLAFEPNPGLACLARRNTPIGRVWVLSMAASEEAGTGRFYFAGDDMWGSLADSSSKNGSILVSTVRVDWLVAGYDRIRVLKVDVEGWEGQVLRGAEKTLQRTDYVMVECTDREERVKASGSSVAVIAELLKGREIFAFEAGGSLKRIDAAYSAAHNLLFALPGLQD